MGSSKEWKMASITHQKKNVKSINKFEQLIYLEDSSCFPNREIVGFLTQNQRGIMYREESTWPFKALKNYARPFQRVQGAPVCVRMCFTLSPSELAIWEMGHLLIFTSWERYHQEVKSAKQSANIYQTHINILYWPHPGDAVSPELIHYVTQLSWKLLNRHADREERSKKREQWKCAA